MRRNTKRSRYDVPRGEFHNFVHFSYSEYLDFALEGEPETGADSVGRRRSREVSDSTTEWSGSSSFSVASKLAREGWQEGRDFIGQIVDQLDNVTARFVTVPMPYNDVEGDYVDIGAYLEGIPENMVRWEEQESPKRVVRILFNMNCSGGVSTDVMRWRGATVLALIDRLEAQGIRVELDLAVKSGNHTNSSTNTVVVTLKEAQEALHIDRLAFHLVHPSSLRRIILSCWERMPAHVVNTMRYCVNEGYGTVMRYSDKNCITSSAGMYDLEIPELHLYTVEESVREIEGMFDVICGEKLTVE